MPARKSNAGPARSAPVKSSSLPSVLDTRPEKLLNAILHKELANLRTSSLPQGWASLDENVIKWAHFSRKTRAILLPYIYRSLHVYNLSTLQRMYEILQQDPNQQVAKSIRCLHWDWNPCGIYSSVWGLAGALSNRKPLRKRILHNHYPAVPDLGLAGALPVAAHVGPTVWPRNHIKPVPALLPSADVGPDGAVDEDSDVVTPAEILNGIASIASLLIALDEVIWNAAVLPLPPYLFQKLPDNVSITKLSIYNEHNAGDPLASAFNEIPDTVQNLSLCIHTRPDLRIPDGQLKRARSHAQRVYYRELSLHETLPQGAYAKAVRAALPWSNWMAPSQFKWPPLQALATPTQVPWPWAPSERVTSDFEILDNVTWQMARLTIARLARANLKVLELCPRSCLHQDLSVWDRPREGEPEHGQPRCYKGLFAADYYIHLWVDVELRKADCQVNHPLMVIHRDGRLDESRFDLDALREGSSQPPQELSPMSQGWLQPWEAARWLPQAIEKLILAHATETCSTAQDVRVDVLQHLTISADDLKFLIQHYGWYSVEMEAQSRGLHSHEEIADRSIEHCLHDKTTNLRLSMTRRQLGIFLHDRAVDEADPLILPKLGHYQEIILSRPDIREKVVAEWNSVEEKKFRSWCQAVSRWEQMPQGAKKDELALILMNETATLSTKLSLQRTVQHYESSEDPLDGPLYCSHALLAATTILLAKPDYAGFAPVALNATLKGACPCPHCAGDHDSDDQDESCIADKPNEGTSVAAERHSKGKGRQSGDDDVDDVQAMAPSVQSEKSKGKARQLDD